MKNRFIVGLLVVCGLLSSQVLSGATQGGVRGRVLLNLQGVEGIPLTFVNVSTGQTFKVRTAQDGSYSAMVPGGSYVVSSAGARGYAIGKAPLMIQVVTGRFASANIEMARALSQPAPTGGTSIFHNPIGCVAENRFPVFDAAFEPTGSVVSARLYFKSNLSDEWFYTEFQQLSGNFPKYKWTMAPDPANPRFTVEGDDIRRKWVNVDQPETAEPGVPPTHRAFLPKVKSGSGITLVTYYLQLTLSDFTEFRLTEIPITVLGPGEACKNRLFAAPAGAPGQLAVLSSGGLAGAPLGFGAAGVGSGLLGAGIGLGALGAIGGVAAGLSGSDPTPTPTPGLSTTATPTPTPSPTSTPTPTPTPTPPAGPTPTPTPTPTPAPSTDVCQVTFEVNPPAGVFGACQIFVTVGGVTTKVTASQTFSPLCSDSVSATAVLGPVASFYGQPSGTWTGACSGDVLRSPTCNLSPTLPATTSVVLECGCDVTVCG